MGFHCGHVVVDFVEAKLQRILQVTGILPLPSSRLFARMPCVFNDFSEQRVGVFGMGFQKDGDGNHGGAVESLFQQSGSLQPIGSPVGPG